MIMKRKTGLVSGSDLPDDQAIIAEYRNSCGSPKKLRKFVKDGNVDDVSIAHQIHGMLDNIENEDRQKKISLHKSKWRLNKGSRNDKAFVGKYEENVATNSECMDELTEVIVNNGCHSIHVQNNEDARNTVESSSSVPSKRRMLKTSNQLLKNINGISLEDFPMTDEEKLLACPFKERRFKGMIDINRTLPYNDIRLNATDIHDIFIKWEVQLRNTQKKYGRILKPTRAIVPTSSRDEELLQTVSTQYHNRLLPSGSPNQNVLEITSVEKEPDNDTNSSKESHKIHRKSRLRPFREKFREIIGRKSNRSTRNNEQANDTILIENSDDDTREKETSSYRTESMKPLPYRTRRRRIASGSSDDTAATVEKDACPICGILVNIKSLQAHANNCLDRSEMTSSYQGIISEDEPLPDEVLQISPKRI